MKNNDYVQILYDEKKNKDGFLYVTYGEETVFGGQFESDFKKKTDLE